MAVQYTVTDNSPAAGQIAWANLTIVYDGTSYNITDGNAPSGDKYVYFDGTTTLKTDANRPTLTAGDAIIFLNDGGTAVVVEDNGGMLEGTLLLTGSVDLVAMGADSVNHDKVVNGSLNPLLFNVKKHFLY